MKYNYTPLKRLGVVMIGTIPIFFKDLYINKDENIYEFSVTILIVLGFSNLIKRLGEVEVNLPPPPCFQF